MNTKFGHVNIIAKDWRKLADFYIRVFNCEPGYPERNLKGEWLEKLTGIDSPEIQGIHVRLPGCGKDGPTIEIFEYGRNERASGKAINLEGFAHIAFAVDSVENRLALLLENGGTVVGELVKTEVDGAGTISVVYARDPEGNIVELQKWNA